MSEAGARPPDLAELLRLLASASSSGDPTWLVLLRDRIRDVARRRLAADDRLRADIDSDDLAQDALVHLVEHIGEFRGTSWAEFFAFVRAIVAQRKGDHDRKQKREKRRVDVHGLAQRLQDGPATPSEILSNKEDVAHLRALLGKMPAALREVIESRMAGEGYAAIAQARAISEANARQRVSRALAWLKAEWRKDGDGDPGASR